MFRTIKYQTGELSAVVSDMKNGKIPMLEVDDTKELEWVLNELEKYSIFRLKNIKPDKKARDAVKEPDFEYRLAFSETNSTTTENNEILYMDIFSEPIPDEDYASIWGD